MTFFIPDVEVYRKGTTIVFSRTLGFKKEKPQFQMQENGVAQENSRTLNHQIMMNIKTKPNLGYEHMHIQIVSKFMSKLKCI